MDSLKVTDPSKFLIHVGVNDIDDQYPEDIGNNLVTIAKKFQEKLKCKVYLSDMTPRNDHCQGHIQAVNQTLALKHPKSISKKSVVATCHRIICMMIDSRNRSASEMTSVVEFLFSNIYHALIGKAPEPETLKKSLPKLVQDIFKTS